MSTVIKGERAQNWTLKPKFKFVNFRAKWCPFLSKSARNPPNANCYINRKLGTIYPLGVSAKLKRKVCVSVGEISRTSL